MGQKEWQVALDAIKKKKKRERLMQELGTTHFQTKMKLIILCKIVNPLYLIKNYHKLVLELLILNYLKRK